MHQPTSNVVVEILTTYSKQDAIDIGLLLPHLSDSFDGSPVPEQTLLDIISSPSHDQLVARNESGNVVGAATVSVIVGAGSSRNAWLEDFVVSPKTQGMGVGSKLWDAMIDWCQDKGVNNLNFTSRSSREAAQAFYLKRGAIIRDTNFFRKNIPHS